MARIGTAYIEISGDFGPLRRQLAQAKLGKDLAVKVSLDRSSAARVKAETAALGKDKKIEYKADFDVGPFTRLRKEMAQVTKESNLLSDVFNRSSLSIGQQASVISLFSSQITGLVGALGALSASLGAATAGFGALAVGAGAALSVGLGGIAAIATPAIKSLKDLMTAQTAVNKARATGAGAAARSSVSAANSIKSAEDSVTSAEEGLANAQRQVRFAQQSLTLARQDATRQLQDMKRAAIESTTAEARGRLGIQQAEANLAQVRLNAGSTALDIRDAELSVTEARQSNRDTQIEAKRAQDDYNKAQKKGIDQMPQVVAAQRSLADSQRGVVDAQRGLTQATRSLAEAQQAANDQAAAGAKQYAALALAQKKAGPLATEFAHRLKDVSHEWHGLTAAGRRDFFALLNDSLKRVQNRLPLFARSANSSVHALRVGVDQFLNRVMGPEFNHFVDVMTRTFANALPPTLRALGNIGKVLERIAVAVAPDIVRMAQGFEDMTRNWVTSTRNASNLQDVVHQLVNQTNTWWKLLKAATDLIIAVLVPGMGQGQKAVKGMTASLREWTDWVNAHPESVRNFMKEGLDTTSQLFEVLSGFLPIFLEISEATRPFSKALLAVVHALNSVTVGPWKLMSEIILGFIAVKTIHGIFQFAKATREVAVAIGLLSAAEAGAGGATGLAAATGFGGGAAAKTATGRTIGSTGTAVAEGAGGGLLARAGGFVKKGTAVAAGTAIVSEIIQGTQIAAQRQAPDFRDALEGMTKAPAAGIPILGGLLQDVNDFAAHISPLGVSAATKLKDALDEVGKSGVTRERQRYLQSLGREAGLTDQAQQSLHDYLRTQRTDTVESFTKDLQVSQRTLRQMNEALGSLKTRTIGDAIDGLKQKYGSLTVAGHEMGKKGRQAFIDLAVTARDNGEITQNQLERITNSFQNSGRKWKDSMRDAARVTGESTQDIIDSFGDMTVRVPKMYHGMIRATGHGLDILVSSTNDLLHQLVSKKTINWRSSDAPHAGAEGFGGTRRQTGGVVVPGTGSGDKVPVRAMVEPGEVLAVLNRKAAQKWMEWNEKFPRFQKGGMTAMVAEAQRFEKRSFPYQWGGGHGDFGIQPVDCSGAVSDVLHAAGLLKAPMTSGSLMSWGKAGTGPLTVYANPHHTVMSLNGRVFGTSGSNPGGGAGWIDGASGKSLAPGAVRTMAVGAGVSALKRVLLSGPAGALASIGQGHLDRAWRAASAFVARQTPSGAFGGGQASVYAGKLNKIFPHPGGPQIAPWQAAMLAEQAGLPGITYSQIAHGESNYRPGAVSPDGGYGLWQMTPRVQSASTVSKWEHIGSYFNPWLNALMAKVLAGAGTGVSNYFGTGFLTDPNKHWHGEKKFQRGGVVAPFVGKFRDGGFVDRTGFGLLHQGETVIPNLQKGGTLSRLKDESEQIRQRARKVEKRLEEEAGKLHPDKQLLKHLERLEKRLAHHEATIKELISEQKEIHRDSKERNRLLHAIRQNEHGGMRAVSDWVASDIGYRQLQKTRQASPGSIARY